MVIFLYKTTSERNKIIKEFNSNDSLTLSGYLRSECSVLQPVIVIEMTGNTITQYNYCYIPEFGRYYFINNIESVRTNVWRIHCNVDVLMSYSQQILNLNVIVSDETSPDNETYMSGEVWNTTVRTKTDVINFPNGLLDNGEYILITSGGVAS